LYSPRRSESTSWAAPSPFRSYVDWEPWPSSKSRPRTSHSRAKIASDLTRYHEAKILHGIEKDTLFDFMRDDIEEGGRLFQSRHAVDLRAQSIRARAGRCDAESKGHINRRSW